MATTNPSTTNVDKPPRRRRRWPWYILGTVGFLFLLACGGYWFLYWSAGRQTAAIHAEMDRLDPGWRWADMEAARETLSPEENSAVQVVKASALARANARTWKDDFTRQFEKLEPQFELNGLQITMLREAHEGLDEALAEARKLKDMPKGRHNLRVSADWITTNLSDQQNTRRLFELMQHDAWVRAQYGDFDGALESCRAGLNAARSIGDEPFLISFLIRVAGDHMALSALERVLAQGKRPSEKSLASMQALIELEMQDLPKAWRNSLRGERAGHEHLMKAVGDGKIRVSQFGMLGATPSGFIDRFIDHFPVVITSGYPALVRHMNEVVAATELPLEQQSARMLELEKEIPRSSIMARLLAPAVQKVTLANQRNQAMLRSAQVIVAAERFRVKHDRWPALLADLVQAGLISAPPTDPYDGAELRWRRFDEGFIAYSVGHDMKDDNGNVNNLRSLEPGVDLGFKVWDVARRRQPARPPLPEEVP